MKTNKQPNKDGKGVLRLKREGCRVENKYYEINNQNLVNLRIKYKETRQKKKKEWNRDYLSKLEGRIWKNRKEILLDLNFNYTKKIKKIKKK